MLSVFTFPPYKTCLYPRFLISFITFIISSFVGLTFEFMEYVGSYETIMFSFGFIFLNWFSITSFVFP